MLSGTVEMKRVGESNRIALFILNRPEKANAYHDAMLGQFAEHLEVAIADPSIRAGVVTGGGEKVFCAGADLSNLAGRSYEAGLNLASRQLFDRLASAPWPTVAAIQGPAIAGGLELALACDLRICTARAWFALPELDLGLLPAAGGIRRLTEVVSEARARAMILFGEKVDSDAALAWGLVERVSANVLDDAIHLAATAARRDPLATRLAKMALRSAPPNRDDSSLEAISQALLYHRKTQTESQERSAPVCPRTIAIATATPPQKYTQAEVLERFGITNKKIEQIFSHSHIKSRHLCLPDANADGSTPHESQAELLQKHQRVALDIGQSAIGKALEKVALAPQDLDYLAVVSTTGLVCPSLSAHYIKALDMRPDIHRIDIVGMGCNAGLNGLQPVVNFCTLHPEAIGLLLCVEVCSAMYVVDESLNAAVVNSLFGDGAAAAVISAQPLASEPTAPRILGFESHIIPEAIDAIRLDLEDSKYSLYLDKQIPYLLGQHVRTPVDNLLRRFGRKRRDIQHWVIHSGGRKVIDSIKYGLNISEYDVRHTSYVLQNYGNLSSASFLFSLERLLAENVAERGDAVVFMTMGPGSTIECCLGEF